MVAVTKEKVLEKLNGLKVDTLPRPDGLHPRVLKEIVEALVVIFQESLESGRVPEDWKIANVIPLFKKESGKRLKITGRLCVGKIFESIMKDETSEYLEVH
eukprot:g25290.t1